jgi:Arc/MetJ-type ribon-helix-helix transcriptional regulator
MEVHFPPETEQKLQELVAENGRGTAAELVQDVVEGYFDELAQTRQMLNSRYDDLKSGKVKPIAGEEFFEGLRRREDESLKKQSPQ